MSASLLSVARISEYDLLLDLGGCAGCSLRALLMDLDPRQGMLTVFRILIL